MASLTRQHCIRTAVGLAVRQNGNTGSSTFHHFSATLTKKLPITIGIVLASSLRGAPTKRSRSRASAFEYVELVLAFIDMST